MTKKTIYIDSLKNLSNWTPYLLAESGLPGPRGNLELAAAAAELGDETRFMQLIQSDLHQGSSSANEYLPFCGVVGLGRLLVVGKRHVLPLLRQYANDSRWRLREAVAIAFQNWGKGNMDALLDEMQEWCKGTLLEQRACAAALCEPVLLNKAEQVQRVLDILDGITDSLTRQPNRKLEDFRALRQGLAYCWSVAVAALPEVGKIKMEQWMESSDVDVRWVMRENLKKNRLVKVDTAWVKSGLERMG